MVDLSEVTPEQISSEWWRLTHLYYIRTKKGERVLFSPWPEQEELYRNLHVKNVILKARQRAWTLKCINGMLKQVPTFASSWVKMDVRPTT